MIFAFLAAVSWGLTYYVLGRLINQGMNYWFISAMFLPWSLYSWFRCLTDLSNSTLSNLPLGIFYVIINVTSGYLIYLAHRETSNMFIVTLFEMLYPIFVLAFMIFFREEVFTWNKFFGFSVAILGVMIAVKK